MSPLRNFESKIKSQNALKRILLRRTNKNKKEKIIFTNGCFDLLHRGHVTYLQKARRLGTLLVVALNSDDSVRRLKGPERPLNTLEDRMRVIAALECVDYVTSFGEDTPRDLVILLKPQIIVKGGDWKPEQVAGAPEAKAWGGRLKLISFVDGKSTTSLIERARTPLRALSKKSSR